MDTKYYFNAKDIRTQLPMLWPMLLIFVVGIIYASGLDEPLVRNIIYLVCFITPLVLIIMVAITIPKRFNFAELSEQGINITVAGFYHKMILWKDIVNIENAKIGNVDGLGLEYKSNYNRLTWSMKHRAKLFGYYEMIGPMYSLDGKSLIVEAAKSFNKFKSTR